MAKTKTEKVDLYSKKIGEILKKKFDSIREETKGECMLMYTWSLDEEFIHSVIVGDSEKLVKMFVELMTQDEDFYLIMSEAVKLAEMFTPFGEIGVDLTEEDTEESNE